MSLAKLAALASGIKTFVAPHGVARAAGDSATVLGANQGYHAAAPGTTFGQDLAAHTAIGTAASLAWGKGGLKARLPGAAIGGAIGAGMVLGKEAFKTMREGPKGSPATGSLASPVAIDKPSPASQQQPKQAQGTSGVRTYDRTYTTGKKAGITETVTLKNPK